MGTADKITDEAAGWLIRLEAQTSPELWDALQAWLDADARHRAAFVRLRVAWHRVDALKSLRPVDGTVDSDLLARPSLGPDRQAAQGLPLEGKPRRSPVRNPAPIRLRWLAAACIAAAVCLLTWLGVPPAWSSYETVIGGRYDLTLADGTRVELNTNTQMRTRLTSSRREAALLRGEALFQVAHDAARPFYVSAGHALIRAIGTEFSVRIRDAEHVEVLVSGGRIAIGTASRPGSFAAPTLPGGATEVDADESAAVSGESVTVARLAAQDVARRLAWIGGRLAFQGETLEEAAQEFNRYNRQHLTIRDPAIGRLQVGGVFLARDPASFVAALHRSFGVRADWSNDDIRLSAGRGPSGSAPTGAH